MPQSDIRSRFSTEPFFVTSSATIDRDAVLMKRAERHWSVSLTTYGGSFRSDATTYGLSDGKITTSIVDVIIILDKGIRGDVRFGSQTGACLVRGGRVKRARGGVLFHAHTSTG